MKIAIKACMVKSCLCLALILSVSGCSREQPGTKKSSPTSSSSNGQQTAGGTPQSRQPEVLTETTILSTSGDFVDNFDTPFPMLLFSKRGNSAAYVARKAGNFHAVFNGKFGSPCPEVDHLNISPDGLHEAHSCRDGKRRMVLDGREGKPYDDVWYPVFSPDNRHIAYIAQTADQLSHIVVDDHISEGRSSYEMDPVFSADSSKVVYVESGYANHPDGRVVVSDLLLRKQNARDCRGDAVVINKDRTRLAAAVVAGKKQRVIAFNLDRPEDVNEGPLYDFIFAYMLVFGDDGETLAYAAKRGEEHYLVLNNRETPIPDGDLRQPPVIRPDNKGLGIILLTQDGSYFTEVLSGEKMTGRKYQTASGLVYSRDSSRHAYIAQRKKGMFLVLNEKEGPSFDMIVTPVFSPDGRFLVYRVRKDDRRFVVIADGKDGRTIKQHPSYDQVFQPVFTADGESVVYGVKDGNKLIWKVEKLGK